MSVKAEPWAGRDPQWTDDQKDFEYWALTQAPRYPKNAHVEGDLWSPRLDELLHEGVRQLDWWYLPPTVDRVMSTLDPEARATWAATDPLCKEYSALGVLTNFISH